MRVAWVAVLLGLWLSPPLGAQYIGEFTDPYILRALGRDTDQFPNRGDRTVRFRVGDRVTMQVGPQLEFDRYREVCKLIGHETAKVRLATVLDLKEYGTLKAARLITSRLGDSDLEVRETAAWALGEMGYRSAIRPLIDALGYVYSHRSRQTVGASLRKLTGKNYGTSYRKWWAWYEAVRRDF